MFEPVDRPFEWGPKHMTPRGDQKKAIKQLTENIENGVKFQVLQGLTGTGKTFTIAQTIMRVQKPTLVISHNKTLAAQLYQEFKYFFPRNAVEYFVSFYDYYQPEAYVEAKDLYIEKDFEINEEIDRMRLSATRSLLERRDVVVVASVSCIYSLGSPETYKKLSLFLKPGMQVDREELLMKLIEIQYERNDTDFAPGSIRSRGDIVDVYPPYSSVAHRISFFDDEIEEIVDIHPLTGQEMAKKPSVVIFPARHYVSEREQLERAIESIEEELQERLKELRSEGKFLEANRLEKRTKYDLAMLRELGYCSGIENYSRHFDMRKPGEPVKTLIDFFPKDYLLIIDECHQTIPQLKAMVRGDYSRKQSLVKHGFRLPSAIDNRPLSFEEFQARMGQTIFVSATPDDWSLSVSRPYIVKQIIRPTGLLDPEVLVRPASNQVEDLIHEARKTIDQGWRVLVTTLTKRMAEHLTDYLKEIKFKAEYLHSDIDTLKRTDLLRGLRRGDFDILVGINLLREGLDLPEVALVAILDADKEGFLRDKRSLIQTIGRAARNANGRAILYADKITHSIKETVKEITENRKIQQAYNQQYGIVPKTIIKPVADPLGQIASLSFSQLRELKDMSFEQKQAVLEALHEEMRLAAENLEFEKAAEIRDLIKALQRSLKSEMSRLI